jgi:hypothetical protein
LPHHAVGVSLIAEGSTSTRQPPVKSERQIIAVPKRRYKKTHFGKWHRPPVHVRNAVSQMVGLTRRFGS